MTISFDECSAVILAGGQSRRMGICKALIKFEGKTMISQIADKLSVFNEILLSTDNIALAENLNIHVVSDIYKDSGPLGGLHAALSTCKNDYLFCLPCDCPNIKSDIITKLINSYSSDMDFLICKGLDGRMQPLYGIYNKRVLPLIEKQLNMGNFRVMHLIRSSNAAYFKTTDQEMDNMLFNLNTPQDYLEFIKMVK